MSVKLTGQEVNFTLFISDVEGVSIYKYFVDRGNCNGDWVWYSHHEPSEKVKS